MVLTLGSVDVTTYNTKKWRYNQFFFKLKKQGIQSQLHFVEVWVCLITQVFKLDRKSTNIKQLIPVTSKDLLSLSIAVWNITQHNPLNKIIQKAHRHFTYIEKEKINARTF